MRLAMSEEKLNNDLLVKNVKKFVKITLMVMFLALIVGDWLVYEKNGADTIYRIELLMPVIVATIILSVGLRIYRSKLFASKDEFKKTSELFKQQNEAKE